jgi:hypothetical protein
MDSNFEPGRDGFCLGFPALYEYVERRFANSTGNFKIFLSFRGVETVEESAGAAVWIVPTESRFLLVAARLVGMPKGLA